MYALLFLKFKIQNVASCHYLVSDIKKKKKKYKL